jgi:shikimate kinase
MGAGKTSVGRSLGQRLNWVFEDLDDRIEQREKRKIAEIFRESGEPAFRRAEHLALQQVIEELRSGVARVLALGGGAFVQKTNAALLQAAAVPVVFLDAPIEELWRRCCADASDAGAESSQPKERPTERQRETDQQLVRSRPLLTNQNQFRDLYSARRAGYLKASLKIETLGRRVEEIAAEIVTRLKLQEIAIRTEPGEME